MVCFSNILNRTNFASNKVSTVMSSTVYDRNMRWNYYSIVSVSRGTNGTMRCVKFSAGTNGTMRCVKFSAKFATMIRKTLVHLI